jgi:hypothetical protein
MVINISIPGAKPNDTKSAKESRSLPIGELMPSFLATNPSKKSKIIAKMRSKALISNLPKKAIIIAITPQRKLPEVIKFGRLNNFWPISFISSEGNSKIAYIYRVKSFFTQ